ncbi:unnamed protein product, partial [Laminaria digitata]
MPTVLPSPRPVDSPASLSPRARKAAETAAALAETRAAAAAASVAATASVAETPAVASRLPEVPPDSSGKEEASVKAVAVAEAEVAAAAAAAVEEVEAKAVTTAATAEALAAKAAAAARDPRKDPEYAKFFDMLEAGVARETVELAMVIEGKYPAVLNTPVPGPAVVEATSAAASEAAADHPDFFKFFKMLKMGMPRGAALQAMAKAGADQAVLDDPDAMLPLETCGAGGGGAADTTGRTAAVAPTELAARDHPDYFKFFKMLNMGMPRGAALQAMAKAGADQAVLDDPEAMLPLSAAQQAEILEREAEAREAREAEGGGAADATRQAPAAPSMMAARDHPDYFKYFKMLKMGMPRGAALQKMATDGVDQAILDTPDAMFPLPPSEGGEALAAAPGAAAAAAAVPVAPTAVAAKDHPDYFKFFKMLKMG